jgi:RimJ/RimL family protein N-acetyltransferase
MRIETARLVIRTFEPRDAEPWIAMVSDPDVRRFIPPGPVPTLEVFQSSMERRHTMEGERGYAVWAVDAKATGTFIGQCGFLPLERTGPEVELAYHYNKESWNKGYATEALIAVLTHGLGPVGLDRVIGLVVPENVGSWRAMEKAVMRFEGTATYYDMPGLKKYVAEREWWGSPQLSS